MKDKYLRQIIKILEKGMKLPDKTLAQFNYALGYQEGAKSIAAVILNSIADDYNLEVRKCKK